MIKALFFDIDGTLYRPATGVPKETVEAINTMHDKGYKTCIATGRLPIEIDRLPLDELKIDAYVCANGQILMDENRTVTYKKALNKDDRKILAELFNERKYSISLFKENTRVMNFYGENFIALAEQFNVTYPQLGTYNGEEAYFGEIYVSPEQEEEVMSLLNNTGTSRWSKYGIDIFNKDSGKDMGIRRVIYPWGIEDDETMVFGDELNDIYMFDMDGIAVCMGNGNPKAKQHANFVTDDYDKGGIVNALKHFELL